VSLFPEYPKSDMACITLLSTRFRVWGLGFRVWDLEPGISGLRLRISGLGPGFLVQGLGLRVSVWGSKSDNACRALLFT